MLAVFVLSNLVIAAGYTYAVLDVAPRLGLTEWWARLAGLAFFGLCAGTHLEQAAHAIDGSLPRAVWDSWHMLAVHALQAPAIWLFLWGVRRHLGRL